MVREALVLLAIADTISPHDALVGLRTQKEIYEESKHGVAYRDLMDQMNLDSETWVLGKDYSAAPTCATCHMSGNTRNGGKMTHDPGERISWTNRPPVSLAMDTDVNHKVIKETDRAARQKLIADSASDKRARMRNVCEHCHTPKYVSAFYQQYDDFIVNYNEKFAKPGKAIMGALLEQKLITKIKFDEKIEWTWFYLWHHEGRRARHGASMMAPDYAHWHGMYEVAERFYQELIPEAREIIEHARKTGKGAQATAVDNVIKEILARPEHQWQATGGHSESAATPPAQPKKGKEEGPKATPKPAPPKTEGPAPKKEEQP
jgi:cytochrome c553